VTPLGQRMLEDLQIRHYSPITTRVYLHAVSEFAKHFGKPPDQLGPKHIRQYQLFLIKEKQASQSIQHVSLPIESFSLSAPLSISVRGDSLAPLRAIGSSAGGEGTGTLGCSCVAETFLRCS
jgi:integrase/recombinase XerD